MPSPKSFAMPSIEINAGLSPDDAELFAEWLREKPFGYAGEMARTGTPEAHFQTWLLVAFLAGRASVAPCPICGDPLDA